MIRHLQKGDLSQLSKEAYLAAYARIYNSAIELFAEEERAPLEAEAFSSLWEQNEHMIKLQPDQSIAAFLCYHRYGMDCELTALYVAKEHQRKGFGEELLRYLEARLPEEGALFVKVLKNAPWSIRFYEKNGFFMLKEGEKEAAEAIGLTERPWSCIYKYEK